MSSFKNSKLREETPNPLPDLLLTNQEHCHFDIPKPVINDVLQAFSGWFLARDEAYPEFYANGEKISSISFFDRPDIIEIANGCFSSGWVFSLDVARAMTPGQHALVIDVVVGGRNVGRSLYRCDLPKDVVGQKDLVAFIHVPKCGGTSLRVALESNARFFRILNSYNEHGHYPTSDLIKMSKALCLGIDGVYGHFNYGFHENFPRKTRYISMIRNPFDLVLSFYFYARYQQKQDKIINCADIYEAIEKKVDLCFDNVITRMFADVPEDAPVTADVYARALKHLDKDFDFVGILEDIPRTSARIGLYLGINLGILHENITQRSTEYELLDIAKFRAFAAPFICYDLSLYEYVLKKFWGAGNLPGH